MQKTQQKTEEMKSKVSESAHATETLESLRQDIRRLSERIALLENSLPAKAPTAAPTQLQPPQAEEISPDVVLAIAATIAAYLGVEPHIRQIRLLHSHPWGQQGRVTIQASHRIGASHG